MQNVISDGLHNMSSNGVTYNTSLQNSIQPISVICKVFGTTQATVWAYSRAEQFEENFLMKNCYLF